MGRDPVILPSSLQTVDRSTIAKHLLSNETDPFNRQPLTLDQVTPNVDLKNKFLNWEKKKKGLAVGIDTEDINIKKDEIVEVPSSEERETTKRKSEEPASVLHENNEKRKESFSGGHSLGGSKLLPRIRQDIKIILKESPN